MSVFCECLYCGHKWDDTSFGLKRGFQCGICNDKKIKVHKKPERGNFFGYEEDEKEETEKYPLFTDWTD